MIKSFVVVLEVLVLIIGLFCFIGISAFTVEQLMEFFKEK